ncbi:MAG: hypothetical protein ACRDQZ_17885 [Mycobacteriales bacterium]
MSVRACGCWIALVGASLVLLMPDGATGAGVVNGDFESGTLNGWNVYQAIEDGNWFAYQGTAAPIGSKRGAAPVQAPPQGAFAAIADEADPDTLILYQDIALTAGQSHQLSLLAYYNSYAPLATPTPDTLSVDNEVLAGQRNQQFRIDVMRPSAPLESLAPADTLLTLFSTKPGGPVTMPPTKLTADLTPFAGQTVRLRIATAVHEEVLNAGVDAVEVSGTTPGTSPPRHSSGPKRFSIGGAKTNRKKGTARLTVHVPGPGLLEATGKRIVPSRIKATSAGTVTIPLKPTFVGRAVLRRKQKLRVKVAVRYTPRGGSSERAIVSVLIRLV